MHLVKVPSLFGIVWSLSFLVVGCDPDDGDGSSDDASSSDGGSTDGDDDSDDDDTDDDDSEDDSDDDTGDDDTDDDDAADDDTDDDDAADDDDSSDDDAGGDDDGSTSVDGGDSTADAASTADAGSDSSSDDGGVLVTDPDAGDSVETESDGGDPTVDASSNGVVTAPSVLDYDMSVDAFNAAIGAHAKVSLAAMVDHQQNAAGLDPTVVIPPATVYAFGNPNLGTPLMVENPLAALDLPLRLLVWEDAQGDRFVSYDGTAYLAARHGLQTVDAQLMQAMGALANFASAAAGATVSPQPGDASGIDEAEGIVVTTSANSAELTLSRLTAAIDANPMLGIAAIIDHRSAAQGVALEMDFATVVWFGSPAAGTPLIKQQPSVGLDLPMRALVAQTDSGVVVAHNDPVFVADKHGITGEDARLANMAAALQAIADAAAMAAP